VGVPCILIFLFLLYFSDTSERGFRRDTSDFRSPRQNSKIS
jgi:hypothetical protein